MILATGGFERDPELTTTFLRGPMSHPAGVPTNTGDGLRMAMRIGAKLGVMREAWWVPVVAEPGDPAEQYALNGVQFVQRERSLPRNIMVNVRGQRFTNEAANYNALGGAFHAFDPTQFRQSTSPVGFCSIRGSSTSTAATACLPEDRCRSGSRAPTR